VARNDPKINKHRGEFKNIKKQISDSLQRTNSVLTEVDVLPYMSVTCPISHLEMSALKAPAPANTTHHPKRSKQWARRGGWARNDADNNKHRSELKINQKTKSVTPSNEQISETIQ
jgi:hypothetical protein